ncbi:30S ribosomal protein S6 [Chloroflexota bacterium]
MVSDKVVTEEGEQLPDYELVLVISPEVAEEEFEATIDKVSQFVNGKGGAISDVERWGKKRLAYPIRHFVEGSYVLTRFKLKPAFGKELEANLRISEEVLRHLLIRVGS